jgi:DNA-binding NarL/FixJ family response regulator
MVTRRLIAEFASRPRPHESLDVASGLTDREVDVLRLVARGLSNAEIAQRLTLSPLTVKTHVSRMLTKLSLRDRAQLVVVAYESGVVSAGQTADD